MPHPQALPPYGWLSVHTPSGNKNDLRQITSEHAQKISPNLQARGTTKLSFFFAIGKATGKLSACGLGTSQDLEKAYMLKNSVPRGSKKFEQAYP